VAAVVVGGAMLYFLSRNPHPGPLPGDRREHNLPLANYVGSERCISCHTEEAAQWQKSQHHAAMVPANAESVHGDFNNAKFNYTEITSTFFKRNGKFFVNTDGPEGKLADYEVKYTFGVSPLQQYLIGFPDGRLQALSIAWDSRPKKEGGQRWFHLYPNERITYDDELHWTRPSQNWNFMCADCHSTDIRKNYDAATDKFQTRWAEISVGCEACHGPGSRHLEWAGSQIPPLKKGVFESAAEIPLDPPFPKGEGNPTNPHRQGSERAPRRTAWHYVECKPGDRQLGTLAAAHSRSRDRGLRAMSRAPRPDRGGLPSGQALP
jgi:hypothetical protein